MTHTTTDAAEARGLPVTQADRDAALETVPDDGSHSSYMLLTAISEGRADYLPLVQDAARHRLATAEAASGAGEGEESWTGDPHGLAAELRRVASGWGPGFRLPQLLRDAADEIDCLSTHASLPPATDPAMVRKPKTAAELKAIIDDWLARDCDWGDWEKALDRLAKEDVSERSAVVAMLRADADTMRQNAEAYREESPADARALSEVATTLAIKAFQIERGDHLKETTAALAAAPTIPATGHAATEGEGA